MRLALEEAEKSLSWNEVPVGAVIVSDGKVVSRAHNKTVNKNDPTAHAEIVAIRKACRKTKNFRLMEYDLYVTLEPCAMCLGAMVQARISRLVYGTKDPKGGAVESIMVFPFEKTNHKVEVKSGVLARECGRILTDFFQKKRVKENKKNTKR